MVSEGPGDASEEEVVDTADNAREIRQRGSGGNKQALLLLAWCCERLFVLLPAPWSARAPSPSRSPSASRSDLRVWCGRGVAFAGSFFAGSFFAGAAWPFAAADGHGAEIGRCRWRGRTWSRRTWWSSLVIQGVGGVKENPRVGAGSTLEYRSPSSRVIRTYYESVSVLRRVHIRKILPVAVCRHPCYSRTRPCLRARPSTTQSRPQSKPSKPSRPSLRK